VGGGIYGACLAWEAVSRSLSVALVEKNDFCSGTSANSLKTIHGGLRYLQSADFKRLHVSSRERTTLLHIAPHLVHVLPVIVPTYGYGKQSKPVMALALQINDLLTSDRKRLADPEKRVPDGEILSKQECLERLPGIEERGLTGGAVFYDAQVYNSERLALAFLYSAAHAGADIANYAEVTKVVTHDGTATGVTIRDCLSGTEFDVRAKMVINAVGPWLRQDNERPRLIKAVNIITRPLFEKYAVGLSGRSAEDGTKRLYFVSPWRDYSIVGTHYEVYEGHPDQFDLTEADVESLLNGFNQAYPSGKLTRDDVKFVHGGLLPGCDGQAKAAKPSLMRHPRILDQRHHHINGLIVVEGVKYTTARHVAEKVIDRVFEIRGKSSRPSISAVTPLQGGEIEYFSTFVEAKAQQQVGKLNPRTLRRLIYNYGTAYPKVLKQIGPQEEHYRFSESDVIEAEVLYGIRKEMAQTLSDVVFRRTDLGTAERPPADVLQTCANVMGAELGWDDQRKRQEINAVLSGYEWAIP
jgi:glycerol-3-phosphate dehydrogenase